MNERGVETLVAAGMKGVKQCKGVLQDADGAMCAGGVLLEALRQKLGLPHIYYVGFEDAQRVYGMTPHEWTRMVDLNNHEGLDFIGIARKLGPDAA